MAELDRDPPCEEPGGILDDGTCQWGFPDLLPSNVLALSVWGDVNVLGWDAAVGLRNLTLTGYEAEELLYRLRVIALEVRELKREDGKDEPGSVPQSKARR